MIIYVQSDYNAKLKISSLISLLNDVSNLVQCRVLQFIVLFTRFYSGVCFETLRRGGFPHRLKLLHLPRLCSSVIDASSCGSFSFPWWDLVRFENTRSYSISRRKLYEVCILPAIGGWWDGWYASKQLFSFGENVYWERFRLGYSCTCMSLLFWPHLGRDCSTFPSE